jgi:hypothetical protein
MPATAGSRRAVAPRWPSRECRRARSRRPLRCLPTANCLPFRCSSTAAIGLKSPRASTTSSEAAWLPGGEVCVACDTPQRLLSSSPTKAIDEVELLLKRGRDQAFQGICPPDRERSPLDSVDTRSPSTSTGSFRVDFLKFGCDVRRQLLTVTDRTQRLVPERPSHPNRASGSKLV